MHKLLMFTGLGLLLFTAGCQTYQALPLELSHHLTDWRQTQTATMEELFKVTEKNAEFSLTDGVSLVEAEAVALVYNAKLRTARLKAGVPLATAENSGYWKDPSLGFDGSKILDNVSKPWTLAGSLGITIPISGLLTVETAKAYAELTAVQRELWTEEWRLKGELRTAWFHWSVTKRKALLLEDYLRKVEKIQVNLSKLVAAGELKGLDARIFEIELGMKKNELQKLHFEAAQSRLALLALMGLHPHVEFRLSPELNQKVVKASSSARVEQMWAHHPELLALKAAYEVSELNLKAEIRKQYPDLEIGPGYETESGERKLGLGAGISLPVWNRNQQGIAAAKAARLASKGAVEAKAEELLQALASNELKLTEVEQRLTYLLSHVKPLVMQQLDDTGKLLAIGEVEVMLLLETLQGSLEFENRVLDVKYEEAIVGEKLRALLGDN